MMLGLLALVLLLVLVCRDLGQLRRKHIEARKKVLVKQGQRK